MQQLVFFLQKYKFFLYFLFIEIIAIVLIINNHNFHKSKLISSANYVSGTLFETKSNITDYFHLKEENKVLVNENIYLQNELIKLKSLQKKNNSLELIDSLEYNQRYTYIPCKIVNNEHHKKNNFITINKGEKDGVFQEMAVINNKGIVGVTDNSSNRYARVQSILNTDIKINARFKKNFHFGTLTWNGEKINIVQLTDIPRQAVVNIGDTIITGGKSTIFPEGIPIGTVVYASKEKTASNVLDIKLFNDMTNIGHTYVVNCFDKKEIRTLENNSNE